MKQRTHLRENLALTDIPPIDGGIIRGLYASGRSEE